MLADSTGIKFLGEGEWKTKKHGAERRRQWCKVHLGIDADTMQIRAIVVTTNEVGDSPVGAELLNQIPSHETVVSLTGDGAYDTQDVHEACHRRGVIPVIPPRKGARLRRGLHSPIAMRQSRDASDWVVPSGNAGAATTADHWWRQR